MTMPVLPGLNATENTGSAGPVTDVLDGLSPEQITELVYTAQDWSDAGEPPIEVEAAEPLSDPDASAPVEDPLESEETVEDEAAETPEEQEQEQQEGTEDMAGLLGQVQSAAGSAEGLLQQFDDLEADAKEVEDQGGDPDSIVDLKEEAQDYVDEIIDLMKEAESAAKDEDANGVAQAGLHIQEKCKLIQALLQKAAIHAETNTPAPKGEGSLPDAAPALSLWASRYGK